MIIIFLLIALGCTGFLIYNWPPASVFMGDSGSVFLGYIFGALIFKTSFSGDISIWTWIVVFGYFFADTNVTILLRFLYAKKWYQSHRSHAYQNLAQKIKSHVKITCAVQIYNLLYLLPLAIWTVLTPKLAPLITVIALIPASVLAFRFGPRYSSN